jgi:hypothetical protein
VRVFDGHVDIMDIVCKKRDLKRSVETLRQSLEVSRTKSMKLWLTQRYAMQLEEMSESMHETEFRVLCNPLNSEMLNETWWLSIGDTEYR